MPPSLQDRVRHILDATAVIEQALRGRSREAFMADRLLRLAVERALEMICEASRHIPPELRAREPSINWRKMTDFGNKLRHAYHETDPALVWSIVRDDLPQLKA